MELTDSGFDYSVLSEFRARLIAGGAEHQVFDALLAVCKERGYLKARGRQRTDATHVLGAVRLLNRLELVAETLRAALNALAVAAPDWLRQQTPPEWFARYGRRIEEYRLPQGADARQAYAETVGRDGLQLLAALDAPDAPATLHQLPAVALLRATWSQQYVVDDEPVRLREPEALLRASEHCASPHEPEARYGRKRGIEWVGYKVHLTESCDAEGPHLLTQVETTIAPAPDVAALPVIQAALAQAALLPAVQLVDTGYVCGANLVASRTDHQIALVGPMYADHQWQAKAQQGFALAHFQIDWAEQVVTCPQGRQSVRWQPMTTARGRRMLHVAFAPADCTPCPVRAQCTRAKSQARTLTLQPQAEHEAIAAARQRQGTAAFAQEYAARAGIEGTIAQGVRAFGLRRARYRGLAKTHLQHLATATAINLDRLLTWLTGVPRTTTRSSRFAALHLVA